MVYSLLLDFHHSFAMTPAFFYASLFAISFHFLPLTPALLVNEECSDLQQQRGISRGGSRSGGGLIGGDFGCVRVGWREEDESYGCKWQWGSVNSN